VVTTQAPPAKPAPATQVAQALRPQLPAAPPAPKAEPAPAKPAPVAKAEPAPAKAAAGAFAVQIGALSSTALADKAWSEAVAVAPGLAAGKGKGIEKLSRNGGTLYRTTVTGFATRDDAQAFCGKLKAAGKACFVR
jgi:cell division septation protein DedD